MNVIELPEVLRSKPGWGEFVDKLKTAMADEYRLDSVTVVLREMTAEEARENESELLTFSQQSQRFELALQRDVPFPAAWKIADRIDSFLNPDAGGDG
ncbi:MAG TPA: hypothetical protein VFR18_23295 [Terriglobia bacterium]|nr:hypothetical protein [Terriglobia bacterium]